ncbi:MAG: hypothetical protein ACRD3V_15835, partial [Vicinamibacteria bacterium]
MTTGALFLATVISVTAETNREDAERLLRRVIEAQERQQELTRQYAFRESTETRNLDGEGRTRNEKSETFLVTPGPDGEYRRLVAKNGEPLRAEDEAKEEKKFQKHLKEQLRLSAEERDSKTKEKLERRVKRFRERLEEAIKVFHFEPLEDELLQGEPVRVFRFSPEPGYEGHSRSTRILARMEGRVWIDPRRDQLARLEIRVRESLKFLGGVFGRVSEGSEATAEAFFDGENLWLLDRVDVSLDARLYFLKNYRQEIAIDYHDYEKYTVDTEERPGTLAS